MDVRGARLCTLTMKGNRVSGFLSLINLPVLTWRQPRPTGHVGGPHTLVAKPLFNTALVQNVTGETAGMNSNQVQSAVNVEGWQERKNTNGGQMDALKCLTTWLWTQTRLGHPQLDSYCILRWPEPL